MPILLLASAVHVVRRNLFDFLLFFGTAMLILADSQRRSRVASARPRSRHLSPWILVAGMTLFAAAVALAPPASLGAILVMAAVGAAAVVLILVAPDSQNLAGRARQALAGWPVWATLGVAVCLWELASFIEQQVWPADQVDHPAASDLIGPLLGSWVGRTVLLLLWAGAGWWLLAPLLGSDPRGERGEPAVRHTRIGSRSVDGRAVRGRTVDGTSIESREQTHREAGR